MKRPITIIAFLLVCLTIFGVGKIVDIQVLGIEKTLPWVVINLSGIKLGDEYDLERLERAKLELEKSGLFALVYMQVSEINGDYRLTITVQETNTIYPYFGQYSVMGVGERNLFGSGAEIFGGIRFLRFTTKKLLGFIPVPQLFWGGFTLGTRLPSFFVSGVELSAGLEHFKEVPWHAETLASFDRLRLGTSYPFNGYELGLSYSIENATFLATPVNDYILSTLTGTFVFNVEGETLASDYFHGNTALTYGFGKSFNYLQQRVTLSCSRPIFERIYLAGETKAGITYIGQPPVTHQFYLGGDQDLKGWNPYRFNPRLFIFQVFQVAIPLNENFKLASLEEAGVYTPKVYLMVAVGDRETLGLAVGIGFHWQTPLGLSIEPQIFFGGDGFKFYFKFS